MFWSVIKFVNFLFNISPDTKNIFGPMDYIKIITFIIIIIIITIMVTKHITVIKGPKHTPSLSLQMKWRVEKASFVCGLTVEHVRSSRECDYCKWDTLTSG